MELFNHFFVSYTVMRGPSVVLINKTMLGKIILYPSKKNIFIRGYDYVFVYDNDKVELSDGIVKFLNYTSFPENDFQKLCMSVWLEDPILTTKGIYEL
jgi:hypothetical protein